MICLSMNTEACHDVPGAVCMGSEKVPGGMNAGHAKLADWGFTHLPAITPERAVDHGACEEIGD